MEDFEFVEIDLDNYGAVLPAKNDKIALIDADTLAYTACLATEVAIDILPKEFYTDIEWDSIINNPSYDSDKGVLYEANIQAAIGEAQHKLQRILDINYQKIIKLIELVECQLDYMKLKKH